MYESTYKNPTRRQKISEIVGLCFLISIAIFAFYNSNRVLDQKKLCKSFGGEPNIHTSARNGPYLKARGCYLSKEQYEEFNAEIAKAKERYSHLEFYIQ